MLPLAKKYKKVAVIGYHAADRYCMLGDYTPPVPESECVTVLQGMKQEAPEGVEVSYAMGSPNFQRLTRTRKQKRLALAARERCDRSCCRRFFFPVSAELCSMQTVQHPREPAAVRWTAAREWTPQRFTSRQRRKNWLQQLARLGKPTGNRCDRRKSILHRGDRKCFRMPFCMRSIRVRWAAGPLQSCSTEAANPSGRLPVSMPRHVGQIPVCYNYRTSVAPAYCDMTSQPLHTFGEGRSYTTFTVQ